MVLLGHTIGPCDAIEDLLLLGQAYIGKGGVKQSVRLRVEPHDAAKDLRPQRIVAILFLSEMNPIVDKLRNTCLGCGAGSIVCRDDEIAEHAHGSPLRFIENPSNVSLARETAWLGKCQFVTGCRTGRHTRSGRAGGRKANRVDKVAPGEGWWQRFSSFVSRYASNTLLLHLLHDVLRCPPSQGGNRQGRILISIAYKWASVGDK